MTTLNVLSELTTAEKLSLHDCLLHHEMNVLVYNLKKNLPALALVSFLWDTGVRPSELAKLQVAHVDTYNDCAIVQYRGKSRMVRFYNHASDVLLEWIKARPNLPHGRVFFNPMTYEPFSRPEIVKYVGVLLNQSQVDRAGVNIHSFRSSFALRANNHMPPRAMRVLLGLPTGYKDAVVYAEDVTAAAALVGYKPPKSDAEFWD